MRLATFLDGLEGFRVVRHLDDEEAPSVAIRGTRSKHCIAVNPSIFQDGFGLPDCVNGHLKE